MYDVPDNSLLAILKEGAAKWNRWRIQNPEIAMPDLGVADLSRADLRGADLSGANLRGADLSGADLSGADLRGADLRVADLREADLRWANLSAANLSAANLRGANLSAANLSAAALRVADLRVANLSKVDLTGADLSRAIVGWTTFGNIDLRGAKGLESVDHNYPSTIGIDTIYRSNGQIPEVFLRGAGVPDTFITYIRSLVGKPIEFYSCFISYSNKDQEFAKRLHADLQAEKVRCWFAPEDLKIGDRFQERFEEAVRLFDKVMIILSESSVQSRWVEREVNAAREREDRENRTVLFPISIDEAVKSAPQPWAADIRRLRHYGDFTRWKDHDFYGNAFDRLLRDLKASEKPGPAEA
jgi:uncharacterized protein YjbI with pentapeptide repeats